jgi:hypothetical protein
MRDDKDKQIGSATYLKKNSNQYIPFEVLLNHSDPTLIQPMLDNNNQRIEYIN